MLTSMDSYEHILHNMEGNSDEDKNNNAMKLWAGFAIGDSEKLALLSVLGVLHLKLQQYSQAASIFERIIRSSRHWATSGLFDSINA
jgi:uncharacterized protein HemY